MNHRSSVDIVIVGAGAAGLSAGRRAMESGRSFVVVEAMDRIGGRAHTESSTFGVPWDRGCHWLHSASINPWTALADAYGFTYLKTDPPYRASVDGKWTSDADDAARWAFIDAAYEAMVAAGSSGNDVAVTELFDLESPHVAALRSALAGEWSVPMEQVGALNHGMYKDTDENWPVAEGYGALITRHAEGLPVSLSTPVTKIEWGGPRVRVTTPDGTIDAGAVVITVPPSVIQAGNITFDPPLPMWKQEAFDAVRLGNANKVTFQIDPRHLGVETHSGLWVKVTERQGMFFQLAPFGYPMANGFLAGELGAEAEREGVDAILATGLGALKQAYGSDIERHVTASACTAWQSEPSILGAYGATLPGKGHLRKDLATPIDNRLFFAGEATSLEFFSTAHGAHLTGAAAAEAAISAVSASD